MSLRQLHKAVAAVCPIDGISSGPPIRIDFRPEATTQQRDAAETVVAGWDFGAAAEQARQDEDNREFARQLIEFLTTPEGRAFRADVVLTVKQLNLLRKQVIGRVVATWDPASLANNAGASSPPVTVPGALFGDIVEVGASQGLVGWFVQGWVTAANTVVVRIHNLTGGTVNLPSIQWTVVVRRPEVLAPLEKAPVIQAFKDEITGDA